MSLDGRNTGAKRSHFNNMFFSASLAKAKLSNPEHTFTRRLLKKNPVSAIPISRKALTLRRPFGFGFKSFLNEGKTDDGIAPRDVGAGGECGGSAVGGGG